DLIQNFKDVAAQSFYHAFYVQDDWRVGKKLTLNLGLRYDLDTPRTDRYNRMNYFDPSVPSPLAAKAGIPDLRGGLVFVGVTGAGGPIQGDLRNTVIPYTMQYNFNVQRLLPGDVTLQVGYVGNRGLQLQRNSESGLDFDQINPIYLSLGSHLNDLVANPFYGLVNSGVLAAPQVSRAQLLRPYPQFTSVIPLF